LHTLLIKINMSETFKSPLELVTWLMENEGKELFDGYGRQWKYFKYQFWFKDIPTNAEYQKELSHLHLYNTVSRP